MTKKMLKLSFAIIIGFLSTQTFAQKTINLSPHQSKLITNNSMWTLNATCTIQSTNQTNSKIRISVLKNSGNVNGRNLSSGQGTSVNVGHNANISVSAEPGTEVNLINLGSNGFQAVCST